jgi:hypothetical protein
MSWGGRRANAGRKPGTRNKRTIAKVPLLPARVHRQMVEELPPDILARIPQMVPYFAVQWSQLSYKLQHLVQDRTGQPWRTRRVKRTRAR